MVVAAVRWLLTTILFHSAMVYAAFLALRTGPSKDHLKLWVILSTTFAASDTFGYTLCNLVPLYFEIRVIFVWCLLIAEPVAWAHFYDAVWRPSALWLLQVGHDVKQSKWCRRLSLLALAMSCFVLQGTLTIAKSTGGVDADQAEAWSKSVEEMSSAALCSAGAGSDRLSQADAKEVCDTPQ